MEQRPNNMEEDPSEFFVYTSETKNIDIPKGELTHLRVDSSVREIPDRTFCSCKKLKYLQIPETLTRIGEDAFDKCSSLKSVQFVSVDTRLETNSINNRLEDGTIMFPERLVLEIGEYPFSDCVSRRKVIVRSMLPQGHLELGARSFAGCWSIETLHVPSTVSSIGAGTFSYCSRLKHIKLPPTLEIVGRRLFGGCEKLEFIELPATLKTLEDEAFQGCLSLSHIRIPPSIESIGFKSFLYCRSLLSIELPEGILFSADLSYCHSLVNLACEPLYSAQIEQDSRFGVRTSKHRFERCPVNKLCYYQSYHSSEEAMLQLRRLMEDDPLAAVTQVDEFGMTPLHILSLSQTSNVDMLLAVMKASPVDHIIQGRDSFGSNPIGYLCLNRSPNSTEVIRRVLRTRFDGWLGLDRPSSKADTMWQLVDEALAVDWSSRSREIGRVYFELAKYEQRMTILSLVELCLWKIKIDEVSAKEESALDRESCRINSGASIVLPHMLPFLDELNEHDYAVLPRS